jgi:hypothetical protein
MSVSASPPNRSLDRLDIRTTMSKKFNDARQAVVRNRKVVRLKPLNQI